MRDERGPGAASPQNRSSARTCLAQTIATGTEYSQHAPPFTCLSLKYNLVRRCVQHSPCWDGLTCPMLAAAMGVSSKAASLLLQSIPRFFSNCPCSCFVGITSAPCLTLSRALARDGGMTLSSCVAEKEAHRKVSGETGKHPKQEEQGPDGNTQQELLGTAIAVSMPTSTDDAVSISNTC